MEALVFGSAVLVCSFELPFERTGFPSLGRKQNSSVAADDVVFRIAKNAASTGILGQQGARVIEREDGVTRSGKT